MPACWWSHLATVAMGVQAKKRFSREVGKAVTATPIDMELARSLAKAATPKGFRGGKIKEAIATVAMYDHQQAGVALLSQEDPDAVYARGDLGD
ncbi:unnamed protein product, partial [Ectocarpus sp. 6 AP-2014]